MDRRAVLARKRAIHIGFGGDQFRVEKQPSRHGPVVQAQRDPDLIAAVAEFMHRARRVLNFQRAAVHEGPKEITQKTQNTPVVVTFPA